jgi:hypothetical protein
VQCVFEGSGPELIASATAAQGLHNANLIAHADRVGQVFHRITIDKDTHVPSDRFLLVDHAKADAGITRIQIGQ